MAQGKRPTGRKQTPIAGQAPHKQHTPKAAIALGYELGKDPAPKVLAAGKGELAEKILQSAQSHGIPIHQDHPLASALIELEIGEYLPPELYAAVAEVLAFLWRMEQERAGGKGR